MLYSQIVGHTEAKKRLLKMVNEQRVPHALLFSGKDGNGSLPMAIALAQHLFCTNKQEKGACGECSSCKKVSKLIHPDLHLSFPIAKSKEIKSSDDLIVNFREAFLNNHYLTQETWFNEINAENKQPVIPVEESNNIIKKLSYTTYEGSFKISIIWQPEHMNQSSANSLLKILEEPPEKTIFILISHQPEQLLATIISRTQQIPFQLLSEQEIADALIQNYKVNEEVAKQSAMLANGNYSEALAILTNSEESVSFLSLFQRLMRISLKFDCDKAFEIVDELAALGREKQKLFLQYGLEVFRDCLMYNFGEKNLIRLAGAEKQFLEKFAPYITQKNYQKLTEIFNDNYYYVERNANPKILFMDMVLLTHANMAAR